MTVAKHYHPGSKPNPAKQTSWIFVVLVSGFLCGILLFVTGWYLSLPASQRDAVLDRLVSTGDLFPGIGGLSRPRTLLVMGVDMPPIGSTESYEQVRTDTMMVVKLDPASKKVNIVSIPRDSKVYVAGGHGVNKINAAFTLGGPETAVSTVEEALGVSIDNYLVVNIRGVKDVVDALGGIELYVEKPMRYRDRTAKLNINLEPGQQHLDGEAAEGFLRFRHDPLGDIGRIRRQQQFVSAVSARLKDPSVILKLKPLLDASSKYMMTDLSTQDLIGLALFAKGLDSSNFEVATLPGHPSMHSAVSYWIIDAPAAEVVLNRMIIGAEPDSVPADPADPPTVGLLYTAERRDELDAIKSELETRGFDVVCTTSVRRSSTKLITHSHRHEKAVQTKLETAYPGLKDAQLIFFPHGATFESNSCGNSDFTIILGDDTRSAVNQ